MCGIVCHYGRSGGVDRVLNALELLAYRAPDSSGLAVLDANRQLAIRRAVGTAEHLRTELRRHPLPPLLEQEPQIVIGHGRWAMVGAVTEENAHPISDRAGERVICENGSHNAQLMLGRKAEQERWWRARGVPENERIHQTENTSEVLSFEWERNTIRLVEGKLTSSAIPFLHRVEENGITDPEEQALRLAMWSLREGNAHACAFYSRRRPDTLYVTSHKKPIAIAVRRCEDGSDSIMVASDFYAALMLWSKESVETAVERINEIKGKGTDDGAIDAILDAFKLEVTFLDNELHRGKELFVRIRPGKQAGQFEPRIEITRYDGTPIYASSTQLRLNPAQVGKQGHPSFTESHLAEIPSVLSGLSHQYVRDGQVHLESSWRDEHMIAPGLNLLKLTDRFGERLERLRRVLLIGEGSSWRDGVAAAPLFRSLLNGVRVRTHRPVEALNLGYGMDDQSDLAVEISWSGTTDSLLKVDGWLAEIGVLRLGVTGRPQSDLGRRTAASGGMLNVLTGIEVSVATVKGYQAILMTLDLLALQLGRLRSAELGGEERSRITVELANNIPRLLERIIGDSNRRKRIRRIAKRCSLFNKVVVIGDSPVIIEGELKIEELAQIVARASSFQDPSLTPLVERSLISSSDKNRVLLLFNATSAEAVVATDLQLFVLDQSDLFCLVHTIPHDRLDLWQRMKHVEIFVSPEVSENLQPLIDAPFFFDFAVALAYARGLTPEEIDRPRNLAKSVTTTGAERRSDVERRKTFTQMSMAEYGAQESEDGELQQVLSAGSTVMNIVLRNWQETSVLPEAIPLSISEQLSRFVVVTDDPVMENGAAMASATWSELLRCEVETELLRSDRSRLLGYDEVALQLVKKDYPTGFLDARTLAIPAQMSNLSLELTTAFNLMGLAVGLVRETEGAETQFWEKGLRRLPSELAKMTGDENLKNTIRSTLTPYVANGYDKIQIIGGGLDHTAAVSIARSVQMKGFMAEGLYTDSAWHGPLAAVGGPDAAHDTLIVILATDPFFQAAALVDTQVYRVRNANVILVVPDGNQHLPAVLDVDATTILTVPAVPRAFVALINAVLGSILAEELDLLWQEKPTGIGEM